jgi:hypothetical protein
MRKVNMLNRSVFMSAVALTLSLVAFATTADGFTSAAIPGDAAMMVADCGKWCVKVWRVCVCL